MKTNKSEKVEEYYGGRCIKIKELKYEIGKRVFYLNDINKYINKILYIAAAEPIDNEHYSKDFGGNNKSLLHCLIKDEPDPEPIFLFPDEVVFVDLH